VLYKKPPPSGTVHFGPKTVKNGHETVKMPSKLVQNRPQLVTILRLETDPGPHIMRIMKLLSLQAGVGPVVECAVCSMNASNGFSAE